jgi:DUF1009 family protein
VGHVLPAVGLAIEADRFLLVDQQRVVEEAAQVGIVDAQPLVATADR